MDKKTIKTAAKLYYEEYVEGEPLDQNTPIECFVAGAKFIIRANKNKNKCNNSNKIPYKLENRNMENNIKLIHNYNSVIFLDIDGVLNCQLFYEKKFKHITRHDNIPHYCGIYKSFGTWSEEGYKEN